jgi:S1-C subfamily serine protease
MLVCMAAALVASVAALRMSRSLALLNSEINARVATSNTSEDLATEDLLARYRDSICYIYTQYTVSVRGYRAQSHDAVGTGFVVANGLIATNRHVLEGEHVLRRSDTRFRVTRTIAFFPKMARPINLTDAKFSINSDLAVARFAVTANVTLRPLPLAGIHPKPGQRVILLGYPTGVAVMLAKSPSTFNPSIATSSPDKTAGVLATNGLLHPLATYGRLGDVSIYRLVYDAHTAPGGSGGPVIDSEGYVIGINSAFFDRFCGASIGVPVDDLKRLLNQVSEATP